MQNRRRFLVLVFALLCSLRSSADPENFMVGPFTFTRPTDWTWKELAEKSHASARLVITEEKTGHESQVLISLTPSTRDDAVAKWKSYFVEPPPVIHEITSRKVKDFAVTDVRVEGTYRYKNALKPNQTLIGVIVETPKGNICARLIGPKTMVSAVQKPFKKMIEDAVKEE